MQRTNRISFIPKAAFLLSSLVTTRLFSQDSLASHFPNDPNTASQFVSFLLDDDRQEEHEDRDRKKKEKKNRKSKPRNTYAPTARAEEPRDAIMHAETLELLRNTNRTLKSIEALLREDAERNHMRPAQAFQQSNRMQPMQGPHLIGPPLQGPQTNGQQMPGQWTPSQSPGFNWGPPVQNQGNRSPGNFSLRNDGPRNDGPRNDGPRNDGPVYGR